MITDNALIWVVVWFTVDGNSIRKFFFYVAETTGVKRFVWVDLAFVVGKKMPNLASDSIMLLWLILYVAELGRAVTVIGHLFVPFHQSSLTSATDVLDVKTVPDIKN